MNTQNYQVFTEGGKPVKAWVNGVMLEDQARQQLMRTSRLPFIHKHIAAMPDVHYGIGATVGSVVATKGAIIPAAVGVDIGCGMIAYKLQGIDASDLPDSLKAIRSDIERDIPVGHDHHQLGSKNCWAYNDAGRFVEWAEEKHPDMVKSKFAYDVIHMQLGTLGGGNHFIELCLDENNDVWAMLHSGSRGIGNQIGRYFIEKAREDMRIHHINLEDRDLAYLIGRHSAFR